MLGYAAGAHSHWKEIEASLLIAHCLIAPLRRLFRSFRLRPAAGVMVAAVQEGKEELPFTVKKFPAQSEHS